MTDHEPEVAALRKIRVQPSQPLALVGNAEYWRTHVVAVDDDDDPTFDAAEDELDAWIARRNGAR